LLLSPYLVLLVDQIVLLVGSFKCRIVCCIRFLLRTLISLSMPLLRALSVEKT